MARQNPVLDAINGLGQNPYLQQSAAMFGAAGASFAKGASLALKLDALLTNEEQRLQNNVMKTQQMLETAINNRMQQDLAQRKLEMQATQYNNENRHKLFSEQMQLYNVKRADERFKLQLKETQRYNNKSLNSQAFNQRMRVTEHNDRIAGTINKDIAALQDASKKYPSTLMSAGDKFFSSAKNFLTKGPFGSIDTEESKRFKEIGKAYYNAALNASADKSYLRRIENILSSIDTQEIGIADGSTMRMYVKKPFELRSNNTSYSEPQYEEGVQQDTLSATAPAPADMPVEGYAGADSDFMRTLADAPTGDNATDLEIANANMRSVIEKPEYTDVTADGRQVDVRTPLLWSANINDKVNLGEFDNGTAEQILRDTVNSIVTQPNISPALANNIIENPSDYIDTNKLLALTQSKTKRIKGGTPEFYVEITRPDKLLEVGSIMSKNGTDTSAAKKFAYAVISSPENIAANELWKESKQDQALNLIGWDKKNVDMFVNEYKKAYEKTSNGISYSSIDIPELDKYAIRRLEKRADAYNNKLALPNASGVGKAVRRIAWNNSTLGNMFRGAIDPFGIGYKPLKDSFMASGKVVPQDDNELVDFINTRYAENVKKNNVVGAYGMELISKSPDAIVESGFVTGDTYSDKILESANNVMNDKNMNDLFKVMGIKLPKVHGSPGVTGVDPFANSENPRYREAVMKAIPKLYAEANNAESPMHKVLNNAIKQLAASNSKGIRPEKITATYKGKKYSLDSDILDDFAMLTATYELVNRILPTSEIELEIK